MLTCSFQCDTCSARIEDLEIDDPGYKPICPRCQKLMAIKNRVPQINLVQLQQDNRGVWEGHNLGVGAVTTKRSDALELAKAKGLLWIGDEGQKEMLEQRQENVERGIDQRRVEAKVFKDGGTVEDVRPKSDPHNLNVGGFQWEMKPDKSTGRMTYNLTI